jgi:hypothetical protein
MNQEPLWLTELLQEAEQKEKEHIEEMNRLKADQILAALTVLVHQEETVNELVEEELKLIESYRQSELQRIEKKRSWLVFQIEQYARRQLAQDGTKSLRLVHGTIALRKGRDRIEIENRDEFMLVAKRLGLLRNIPEQSEPDLTAILAHIREKGRIPPGVKLIPAVVNFSYSITTNGEPTNGTE